MGTRCTRAHTRGFPVSWSFIQAAESPSCLLGSGPPGLPAPLAPQPLPPPHLAPLCVCGRLPWYSDTSCRIWGSQCDRILTRKC